MLKMLTQRTKGMCLKQNFTLKITNCVMREFAQKDHKKLTLVNTAPNTKTKLEQNQEKIALQIILPCV